MYRWQLIQAVCPAGRLWPEKMLFIRNSWHWTFELLWSYYHILLAWFYCRRDLPSHISWQAYKLPQGPYIKGEISLPSCLWFLFALGTRFLWNRCSEFSLILCLGYIMCFLLIHWVPSGILSARILWQESTGESLSALCVVTALSWNFLHLRETQRFSWRLWGSGSQVHCSP